MVAANKCDALSKAATTKAVHTLQRHLMDLHGRAVVVLPVSGKTEAGVEGLQGAIRQLVPEELVDEY